AHQRVHHQVAGGAGHLVVPGQPLVRLLVDRVRGGVPSILLVSVPCAWDVVQGRHFHHLLRPCCCCSAVPATCREHHSGTPKGPVSPGCDACRRASIGVSCTFTSMVASQCVP